MSQYQAIKEALAKRRGVTFFEVEPIFYGKREVIYLYVAPKKPLRGIRALDCFSLALVPDVKYEEKRSSEACPQGVALGFLKYYEVIGRQEDTEVTILDDRDYMVHRRIKEARSVHTYTQPIERMVFLVAVPNKEDIKVISNVDALDTTHPARNYAQFR